MDNARLEDKLAHEGFSDKTVVLAVASFLGGQAIIKNRVKTKDQQEVKEDGSTVGILDLTSGSAISNYVNSGQLNDTQFRSEEKMNFKKVNTPTYHGIFDDLDGSINPMIGGTNLNYIGVGGVIHRKEGDEQVAVAAYLPFDESTKLYVAEIGKGTAVLDTSDFSIKKIILSDKPAQKNILIESGFMTPATLKAEQELYRTGFYETLGITARDRVTGGIFQSVSGIRDSRQVVMNIAPSHQADYCYLLLSEAGAEVIGQNGNPMFSTSYAMLSIAPSFFGDRAEIKEKFIAAMNKYKGWNPGKVFLDKVSQ